ncbi:MAG: C39 family peptidase [Bacillus sp. (in: firmicutes)]
MILIIFFLLSITLLIPIIFKKINIVILLLLSFYILIIGVLIFSDPKEIKDFLRRETETQIAPVSLKKDKREKKNEILNPKEKILIDAPVIQQFPELPRGCEVTSLGMFLQYYDVKVDKMELANKVKKDKTPRSIKNEEIFWGNPNEGYIGDMYSYNNPGYGVYHKPVIELAEKYLHGKIVNLTGSNFENLKLYLSNKRPIWIITNTTYKKLADTAFEKWKTPSGEVNITYKEHSVLITGYDQSFIYFNDPISGDKNKKVPKDDFIKAWQQMGSQAFSYKLN